jgi:hypothetical protein
MPVWRWSKVAASNGSADPSINYLEGQSPSSLNDSARAAMAAVAQWRDDISGAIVTGGTATAYTISSNQVFDTYAHMDGAMIAFVPHATNTSGGGTTLNVDGLGARALRVSPGVELVDGHLILGTPYVVTYSNADTSFYLQGGANNPYGVPVGGTIGWTGVTAPNSAFAMPYAQFLSRTTYATLWTFAQNQIALGNTLYNNGNGTTTFGIYDGRGRVDACPDNMGGTAASVFPGLTSGSTGGVTGGSQYITQPQLPNVSPAFTGNAGPVSVNSTVAVNQGFGGSTTGGGGFAFNYPTANGAINSTGTFTPSGSNSSINGGVSQNLLNVAQPYIGINKILRVI